MFQINNQSWVSEAGIYRMSLSDSFLLSWSGFYCSCYDQLKANKEREIYTEEGRGACQGQLEIHHVDLISPGTLWSWWFSHQRAFHQDTRKRNSASFCELHNRWKYLVNFSFPQSYLTCCMRQQNEHSLKAEVGAILTCFLPRFILIKRHSAHGQKGVDLQLNAPDSWCKTEKQMGNVWIFAQTCQWGTNNPRDSNSLSFNVRATSALMCLQGE